MAVLTLLGLSLAVPARASLVPFQQYSGRVGISTAGVGTTASSATLTANVPAGSTVLGAYLYSSTYNPSFSGPLATATGTFNGAPVSYAPLGANASATYLQAFRADVTGAVASVVNSGAGGAYTFSLTEGNTAAQDGEALVLVYQNATLPMASVGILDGAADSAGDTATLNFGAALDPSAPGFAAELRLADGHSISGQSTSVAVNGMTITRNAGNYDDGVAANGALITVGDDNDPFSPLLPTYAQDHERYDLSPYITSGTTALRIDTANASLDDIVFLAVAYATGGVATVPEPASLALMASGAAALGLLRRVRT